MSGVLFEKKRIEVKVEGEIVNLKLGNVEVKLDHETAIQLSTWLRVGGKQAKRAAGDTSRKWMVIGNLTAVQNGERPW
jgi:hypothetical protein